MLQEIMQFVSKHPILSLSWIALLIAVVVTTFKSRFSRVQEVSRAETTRLINKEEAVVVDIRSRDDYRKGHIINSVNLVLSDLKGNNLGELSQYKAQPIIVACAHGTSSREAAEWLFKAGFERVFTLKEGISGWSGENLPLARGK